MTRHDCAQLAEELVAYADGELDSARAAEVKLELEACATCRAELDALQRSWAALDALPAADLQPASASRLAEIEAQIRARAGAAPSKAGLLVRFPWLGPVIAAAGVLLVAGLGWSMLRGDTQEDLTAIRPDGQAPTVPRTESPRVGIDDRPRQTERAPKPGQRDTVPEAAPDRPESPDEPEVPEPQEPDPAPPLEVKEPAPSTDEPTAPPAEPDDETGPVIADADFDDLPSDEQELIENLELAMLLSKDELRELSVEELEAELLLHDADDALEGWDPDELEAG